MIRIKANWEYDESKEFPNELFLWAKCPGCDDYVNVVGYICHYLPDIKNYLVGNGKEITVRCPGCDEKFMLVSLEYNVNYERIWFND